MSRSWQRFSSFGAALAYGLVVAGCGMRTLDLVDEQTSTTNPPMEAAVPDVSDTDSTVVASSETRPANSYTVPSTNPGVAPQPPPDDAGVMLMEAGGPPMCGGDKPVYDPISRTCLECLSDPDCPDDPVDQVCKWGGECIEACHSDADCALGQLCSYGHCIECESNFDCDSKYAGEKPFCDFGRCSRTCSANYQCTIDEPICDYFTRDCRGCQSDRECPAVAPICGPFGRCTVPNASEPSMPPEP